MPKDINTDLYPPEQKEEIEKQFTARERLLLFIKEKEITYPQEIINETGIHRNTVYDTLAKLEFDKLIEKIQLQNFTSSPEAFKKRIKTFWDRGLKGGTLKRMSFYILSKDTKPASKAGTKGALQID